MLVQATGSLSGNKEFPDRSHYTLGEPGWEEVAAYALTWATENARARTAGAGAATA